jgi:hypothetical protein
MENDEGRRALRRASSQAGSEPFRRDAFEACGAVAWVCVRHAERPSVPQRRPQPPICGIVLRARVHLESTRCAGSRLRRPSDPHCPRDARVMSESRAVPFMGQVVTGAPLGAGIALPCARSRSKPVELLVD